MAEWTRELERQAQDWAGAWGDSCPNGAALMRHALAEIERLRDHVGDLNVELAASKRRISDLEQQLSSPVDEPDLDTLAQAAHEAYCSVGNITWGDAPALWRTVAQAVRDALRGTVPPKAEDIERRVLRLERALALVEEGQ